MASKISVLVAARKNSKYLSKFLLGYFNKTGDLDNTEILVMLNQDDTWNDDLISYYDWHDHKVKEHYVKFFRENYELGRAGLHKYFNDMVPHAKGDWFVYFCEDHYIIKSDWDQHVRRFIKNRALDPNKVHVIVPKFDNCGAMNHIVSRGFIEAMGNKLGRHGWIDSYINELMETTFGNNPERFSRMDTELFHDFTHDHPNPMEKAHLQSVITPAAKTLPKFDDDIVRHRIGLDSEKLKQALEAGK